MKKTILITVAILVAITVVLFSCKKENTVTTTQEASTLTSRAYQPYNCTTTTAEAASIQLLDPLSAKSWFNLSFCFTPPPQPGLGSPIIYTNGDSLPVTLQIFVNKVFTGNGNKFIDEKIDEFFYYPCFHNYPTPYTRFPQKPNLQNGTFTFPINFKFEKRGLYNKFINSYTYVNDTVRYNWDAYDFGMHSATTNSYAYVRLVIKSDKP